MKEICKIKDCTGCFACMNICPKDAISISMDILSKTIPKIDDKKCIECGLCKNVCPVNTKQVLNRAEYAYAAWSNNTDDLNKSSSGGVAAVFTRIIIEGGGCAFGASSFERQNRHICVTTIDDAEKLRGSKYVQSNIGLIYREVKQKLDNKISVLFIGTPCQIAGLKGYLAKGYENLLTVDLICHGTPPHKYLEEYLDKKTKSHWEKYSFREGNKWELVSFINSQKNYECISDYDMYFQSFLTALIYRDNCYTCLYSRTERVSDITIGDFWGIDRASLKEKYKGKISVILPNTDKGRQFWEKVKGNFYYEKRTVEEAANKLQTNLRHPSRKHSERDFFEQNYPIYGFVKTLNKTRFGKHIRKLYLKYRIYSFLHRKMDGE